MNDRFPQMAMSPDRPRDRDREIDWLLQRLSAISDAEDATDIEMKIWSIWAELGSRSVNRLLDAATATLRGGDIDRALVLMNAVVELAPRFPEGWNRRATVFILMQNHKAALKDLKVALGLEPRHFGALWSMSLAYEAIGKTEAAIEELRRARALNPHIDGLDERLDYLETADPDDRPDED